MGIMCLESCDNSDNKQEQSYDPSKPVIFSDYFPKEGAVRTRLYIDGSNFGNDISKIKVSIGGKETKVIGSNGKRIYCMVPRRAYDGDVKVALLDDNGEIVAEHLFDQIFTYVPNESVSTLCGKVDPETGSSSMIDGTFDEAEFISPAWLLFDKATDGKRSVYVVEEYRAFRRIDLDERQVSTIFTQGQAGIKSFRSSIFDNTRDTIFHTDDNGNGDTRTLPVINYSLRNESFRRVYPYIYDRCGFSTAQHPDGSIFYNTWKNAAIVKARGQYNDVTQEWEPKELFNVNDNVNDRTYLVMHPEGKFAYIMGWNCIQKSSYNEVTKELMSPTAFAGTKYQGGYNDAPGTGARFGFVMQGVFAKNEQYLKEGKEDIYDFYVCDAGNHCIRKITPEGQVTTYAGRGSYSVDGQVAGYIDGDLRKEARFWDPVGITYDEETSTFYVAEYGNKRIRYITVE